MLVGYSNTKFLKKGTNHVGISSGFAIHTVCIHDTQIGVNFISSKTFVSGGKIPPKIPTHRNFCVHQGVHPLMP